MNILLIEDGDDDRPDGRHRLIFGWAYRNFHKKR